MLDAETGQRGFLLTGEDAYLEPYTRAIQSIPKEIATLERLLSLGQKQSDNLERLKELTDQKLAELRRTIEIRKTQGAAPALEVVLGDQGKQTMDKFRRVVSEVERRENSALTGISLDREAASLTALLVTIGASLVLLVFFAAGLEPVLSQPRAMERPRLLVYAAALAATTAATLLRLALTPVIGPLALPFIMFFPAIAFVAWYGGMRAGALSILLSALAADYFFTSPVGSFLMPTSADRVGMLVFLLSGFGVALLGDSQRRAAERAGRAENAERQQRQRFETTLTSIGDAVISTDAEGRILFANKVAQSLVRWPEADILGKHLDEVVRLINEDTRATVESPVAKVLREGNIVGLANHTVLIARDGTEVSIDDSAAPIRGDGEIIQGTVLVFRDITERRRAEQTSHLLASIVESSEDAIITKDLNGVITSWNDGAEKMFGYSADEAISQPISIIAVPDHDEMASILARIKHGERIEQYESVRQTKSGKLVTVSLTVSPVRDATGRIIGAAKIVRDITERVRAAEQLARLNADLIQSNTNLARLNEDLARFTFIASHDLQEPLRMITSYAQLLVKEYQNSGESDARMYVRHIVGGTKHMRELIADLLTYTEIRGNTEEPAEAVDLNAVVETVKLNLKASIDESGAVIISDTLPVINAHAAHFVPLFQNLIGNAIKYRTERPPRIQIAVQQIDGELRFAVSDNGIGIEPEYHETIFVAFKRLHGRKIPGTGIGLAICQRVVERYNGRIWVESEVGKGSTFHVALPNTASHSTGKVK